MILLIVKLNIICFTNFCRRASSELHPLPQLRKYMINYVQQSAYHSFIYIHYIISTAYVISYSYSKLDSIRKWLTDEDNIDDTQDLIVDTVLSVTFLPIIFICCYGFITVYSEVPNLTINDLMFTDDFEASTRIFDHLVT